MLPIMGSPSHRATVGFLLVGLLIAGCSTERSAPSVPPPSSLVPSVTVPLSDGISVTEEQLRRADPCALADRQVLSAYGAPTIEPGYLFTDCEATFLGADRSGLTLSIGFDFAFPDGFTMTPRVRAGVTVYGDTGDDNWCRRGVAVAEHAVISLAVGGTPDTNVTCGTADRALDAVLPKLVDGDLPAADLPAESLANQDACALLRPEEAFRVPGVDKDQLTPGFNGQTCTWGNPVVSDPHAYVSFSPAFPLDADSPRDRTVEIGGHNAVVHPEVGGSNSSYRTLPGCEVRIEYRPFARQGVMKSIEELSVSVTADAQDESSCPLATDLAKLAVGRLPR